MSIDTSKASPDLDLAVAKAVGIPVSLELTRNRYLRCDRPLGPCETFSPSTDWTAAMEAAKAVELLTSYLLDYDGEWRVGYMDSDPYEEPAWHKFASAPTGPLAICAAILKLKASA